MTDELLIAYNIDYWIIRDGFLFLNSKIENDTMIFKNKIILKPRGVQVVKLYHRESRRPKYFVFSYSDTSSSSTTYVKEVKVSSN